MLRTRRLAPFAILLGLVLVAAACQPDPGPKNQNPFAFFTTSQSTGEAPLIVTFDASDAADPDGTIVSYNWDFGDFTTGSGMIVTKTFNIPGSFTVKLTVEDNKGAKGTATSIISIEGAPTIAPTGLTNTGSGCCDTYGDFSWNAVPGATAYQVEMKGFFGGGCVTNHSATFAGTKTSGRVQALGLCLGSKYDVHIRMQANGQWGPWSPNIRITL